MQAPNNQNLGEAMKCLLVADIHYDLRKFDWVVEAAAYVDFVVLAGDHLDVSSSVDRAAQILVVQKYFAKIRARADLLVCSGNHDLDSKDANGELTSKWLSKVRFLGTPSDGDSHRIGDTLFSICPWWDGDAGRQKIADRLGADAADRPARWIWLHHAPPEGSPTSWAGKRSFGDEAVRGWIERFQPDFVFCGHVHQSPFTSKGAWADKIGGTWIFNAGHQIGPFPSHVIVDTDGGQAYWRSLMGGEWVDLQGSASHPFPELQSPPDWLIDMGRAAASVQA